MLSSKLIKKENKKFIPCGYYDKPCPNDCIEKGPYKCNRNIKIIHPDHHRKRIRKSNKNTKKKKK